MGKGAGDAVPPSAGSKRAVQEVQDMIDQLREKTKQKDPNLDVNKELRKIQDKCADLKGEPRRPKTGAVQKVEEQMLKDEKKDKDRKKKEEEKNKDDKKKQGSDKKQKDSEAVKPAAKDPEDKKKEQIKEQEKLSTNAAAAAVVMPPKEAVRDDIVDDPDEEHKDLVDTRLKTIMLLALSFEEDYPKDFYQKLSESGKLKDILKPISSDELKALNKLLGGRGLRSTEKRVPGAMPNMSRYNYS